MKQENVSINLIAIAESLAAVHTHTHTHTHTCNPTRNVGANIIRPALKECPILNNAIFASQNIYLKKEDLHL